MKIYMVAKSTQYNYQDDENPCVSYFISYDNAQWDLDNIGPAAYTLPEEEHAGTNISNILAEHLGEWQQDTSLDALASGHKSPKFRHTATLRTITTDDVSVEIAQCKQREAKS